MEPHRKEPGSRLFGLAAVITAILGSGGIVGLIVAFQPKTTSPINSPSVTSATVTPLPPSTSPSGSSVSNPSSTSSPFPSKPPTTEPLPSSSPIKMEPPIKKCFGIHMVGLYVTLTSQKTSNTFFYAAVVTDVIPNYPASSLGLQQGDAIVALDDRPLTSIDDVSQSANAWTGGRFIDMYIFRPSKYSISQNNQVLSFQPPYTEWVYRVPTKTCPESQTETP